jgi:hypothetical protein
MGLAGLIVISGHVVAAFPIESCRDPGYWDNRSLVLAEVLNVSVTKRPPLHDLKLRTLATLTGVFDCAVANEVETSVTIGGILSAIQDKPKRGDLVVVLWRKQKDGYEISPAMIDYLPGGTGLQIVSGLSDKRLRQILDALPDIRNRPFDPL